MNPNNDEVIARLQASLRTVADRTPMGEARAIDHANMPTAGQRSRTAATVISAAAAVAAIAAVTAVVANNHPTAGRSVVPGAGGLAGPASSAPASPSSAPLSAVARVATPSTAPTSVSAAIVGSAAPQASPPCVPDNDYVIASPAQLTGLTYLLPSNPAGYTFYGAWGTISRNDCPGSQAWYAEYDQPPGAAEGNISLQVRPDDSQGVQPYAVAADRETTVQGQPAWLLHKGPANGVLVWQSGGLDFLFTGPDATGDGTALIATANTLTSVSATDPRIVAPVNCRIAPGNTCPENPPTSASATPSPSPTN